MWESGQTKGDNIKMILRENELGIDSSSLRSHFKKNDRPKNFIRDGKFGICFGPSIFQQTG